MSNLASICFLLSLVMFTGCSKIKSTFGWDEVDLKCVGSITSFGTPTQTHENQVIAARVSSKTFSISGTTMLIAENIPVCHEGPFIGIPNIDFYFDTSPCTATMIDDNKRKYGDYNAVTGRLNINNQIWSDNLAFIQGVFDCKKIN